MRNLHPFKEWSLNHWLLPSAPSSSPSSVDVLFNMHDWNNGPTRIITRTADRIVIHPNYNTNTVSHSIPEEAVRVLKHKFLSSHTLLKDDMKDFFLAPNRSLSRSWTTTSLWCTSVTRSASPTGLESSPCACLLSTQTSPAEMPPSPAGAPPPRVRSATSGMKVQHCWLAPSWIFSYFSWVSFRISIFL